MTTLTENTLQDTLHCEVQGGSLGPRVNLEGFLFGHRPERGKAMRDFWEGIRALNLKGKGIVCEACIEADKKLGRRAIENCICYPDDSPYTCAVCGQEIRRFTKDERITIKFLNLVIEMSEPTQKLLLESLELVSSEGMDVEAAYKKTGFWDAYKAEKAPNAEGSPQGSVAGA